ncbi:MAG: alpha/beta hydrolase-fold protein [Opitutaceae bacterium]
MHPRRFLPLALAFGLLTRLMAQPANLVSPEIAADGAVTFRYYAPAARQVSLAGLRRATPVPMEKSADGVWSVTISGLAPDIYSYVFDVDGAVALDPRNRSTKKWINSENAFEFTGGTAPAWSLQPVPHGAVHRHTFHSATAGREYSLQVYTPPGYDPRAAQTYPVVVLCHGYGDDETAWVENGRAHLIADNLIARGAMRPAVIVMPHGHPLAFPLERVEEYFGRNLPALERTLLDEILPFLEREYRVATVPAQRAIVGLSMGGGHALGIGLKHPETFLWVGAFSAAVPPGEPAAFFPAATAARTSHRPQLLWIAIGRDDFLLERNEAFRAWLAQREVPFTYELTDGGHEWTNWRNYLTEFLPLLFR